MSLPRARKASATPPHAGPRSAASSFPRHWRRGCAANASATSQDARRPSLSDQVFFLLLIPLAALSLPSLAFCSLQVALWAHGIGSAGAIEFHLPPQTAWDHLFAAQSVVYHWVSRWNSLATLGATAFFVCTLLRPRWRSWSGLALVPYGILLCADFTLRWRPLP